MVGRPIVGIEGKKVKSNKEASFEMDDMALMRKRSAAMRRRRTYWGYLWILPAIVGLLLFNYYPPIVAVIKSFTEWNGVNFTEFIWFRNYKEILTDPIFWKGIKNVVILTAFQILIGSVFADIILAELIFNLKSEKASKFFRFAFLIPVLVPGMVGMLVWTKIILTSSPTGFLNYFIGIFGIEPRPWLGSKDTALISLMIMGFPWIGGSQFLIYLAGLYNIPASCVEASKLDGITAVKRIIYIDLPYLLGQVKYFVTLGFISGIQGFGVQMMITGGGPDYATTVPGYYMYNEAFGYSNYGYACAVGMILFVIIFVMTIINKVFLKTTEDKM